MISGFQALPLGQGDDDGTLTRDRGFREGSPSIAPPTPPFWNGLVGIKISATFYYLQPLFMNGEQRTSLMFRVGGRGVFIYMGLNNSEQSGSDTDEVSPEFIRFCQRLKSIQVADFQNRMADSVEVHDSLSVAHSNAIPTNTRNQVRSPNQAVNKKSHPGFG
ncbi:hypothetical protein PoB_007341400 [Plakobranchus ocellatus]|uniref:Uncharacterized protein n=1 Tax=Plakobranchus ocellatus TaxID=259542 RepID=A0AAV4DRY0_9GAST|nr:hypothetical protein PoB_007341400 [Plakobranchus ocellatus]